ncbi:hypothetical protein Tco_1147618, partial [Tanacetum coccineum]
MEVPDAMINDAIKKKAGYTYYMAKKVEIANVPNKLKKDVVPRKTRSLTIAEETVVGELANSISIQESRSQQRQRSQLTIDSQTDKAIADMYNEWGQKLKGPAVEDLAVQSLLDLQKGLKVSRLENSDATLYSSSSDKSEESTNETDDAEEIDMDLSNDNPQGDDDARYGVFMHNKSTTTPSSTYLSLTVTSSSLDFIHTLLDETPANELTDFISHDAHTTSVVQYPEENPKLTSYISGNVPDKNACHIPSLPAKKIPYHTITSQPSSLQAKAKKLMQKSKKNMRKFNFKKAVAQKFKEYDQKLEAFTKFNVSKAFEKAVQAKSNDTHTTHQKLYDTLYEFIILDQDAIDAQAAQLSFHKRSYDNQDPSNNREGENKKKRRKDVCEPYSRSSRRNRSPVVTVQDHTPAMQPLDQADTKKFKELIHKDELTIADLEGARLERLKVQYNNDVELEYHVSQLKVAVLSEAQWNNLSIEERYTTSITKHYAARYYKEGIEDRIPERWSKEVLRYHFEALNVRRSDDKEYEISYADLPRLNVNDVKDMLMTYSPTSGHAPDPRI